MTTLLQLRTAARIELAEPTVSIWTDAQLNQWLNDALLDYAKYNIPEKSQTFVSVALTKTYTLATQVQRIYEVQNNGVVIDPARYSLTWAGNVQKVTLTYDPGAGVTYTVVGAGFYTSLVADTDVTDLETQSERPVMYFACWQALRWLNTRRDIKGFGGEKTYPNFEALYRKFKDNRPGRAGQLESIYG